MGKAEFSSNSDTSDEYYDSSDNFLADRYIKDNGDSVDSWDYIE